MEYLIIILMILAIVNFLSLKKLSNQLILLILSIEKYLKNIISQFFQIAELMKNL